MKLDRLFGVAACIIVALGLVLAFLVIGPPSHARLVALDQQRVRDLGKIASGMHDRFADARSGVPKRLPSDLVAKDPATRRQYEFKKVDARNYVLCARFDLAAENEDVEQTLPGQFWPHGAGRTCYQFSVTASDVAPRVIPAASARTQR